MRKSSRGNPWHDERGRFCSGPKREETVDWLAEHETAYNDADRYFNGIENASEQELHDWISEHDTLSSDFQNHFGVYAHSEQNDYSERTEERAIERHAQKTGKSVEEARKDFNETVNYNLRGTGKTEADKAFAKKEAVEDFMSREYKEDSARLMGNDLNKRAVEALQDESHYIVKENGEWELTTDSDIQEGMIVEYAPDWCNEGEEKYVHVVKEVTLNPVTGEMTRAKIATINTSISFGSTSVVDFEMIQPASKRKVDAVNREMSESELSREVSMPWQTDPKYKNQRNAQLRWLMDHPESKYNNQEFVWGIKRIETMADAGISAKRRRQYFIDLCKKNGIDPAEGKHFIQEEFLE